MTDLPAPEVPDDELAVHPDPDATARTSLLTTLAETRSADNR
jgi:hypothetical protein